MADPTARYVLTAVDRTRAATNSALRNFKSIDTGVRRVVRNLNLALSVVAGVGLRQLNTAILRAAEGNREFAAQMERVRDATRNLVAGGDLREAISALEGLEKTLRDPEVAKAAQRFTSQWVTGWAKFKAGALEAAVAFDKFARKAAEIIPATAIVINAAGLSDEVFGPRGRRVRGGTGGGRGFGQGGLRTIPLRSSLEQVRVERAASDARLASARAEFAEHVKFLETLEKEVEAAEDFARLQRDIVKEFDETWRQTFDERNKLEAEATSKAIDERTKVFDYQRSEQARVERERVQAIKDTVHQTVDIWARGFDRTARSFLKAMLTAFADRALQNAIDSLFSLGGTRKAGGAGGFLGFLGGLLGFQTGGAFTVGGSGGADSKVVAFRATPGERVTVSTPGQHNGSAVNITTNIDARGATTELIRALPMILRENNAALENQIVTKLRKGAYDRG